MPTIFITGANRGLGLEFTRQYAADGWNVMATCRDPENADDLGRLMRQYKSIHLEPLDVTDQKSIAALADKLKSVPINVLINNAGVLSGGHPVGHAPERTDISQTFGSIDPEAWLAVLKTNSIAPIMVLQAFTPHLLANKEGKVVNITSKMGSLAEMGPSYTAYRSSKAALNAAMRSIASDLDDKKIIWANLHPGWVQTDMGGPNADVSIEKSVTGMRKVIAGLTLKNTGQFLDYTGKVIPW